MDNIIEASENNPVMGRKSALIPDSLQNYKPTIYERMDFFQVPFDINNLAVIDGNIWCPAESDKTHMSESAYNEALKTYHTNKQKLYFTNTKVNYDSCDCGSGYPCNHSDWPFEIEVQDKQKNITHTIQIEGDDCLIFAYNKTEIQVYGLKNFTYGDFIRFCKLCDITLESNYIL